MAMNETGYKANMRNQVMVMVLSVVVGGVFSLGYAIATSAPDWAAALCMVIVAMHTYEYIMPPSNLSGGSV